MTEAVARGYLNAPGFLEDPFVRHAYLGAEWIGPTQGQIDPVKEVQAAEKRLALKLTTRSEECAAITGTDWDRKVPQILDEEELVGAVKLSGQTSGTGSNGNTDENDDENDNEGDEQQGTTRRPS
jgi:capsid protein